MLVCIARHGGVHCGIFLLRSWLLNVYDIAARKVFPAYCPAVKALNYRHNTVSFFYTRRFWLIFALAATSV